MTEELKIEIVKFNHWQKKLIRCGSKKKFITTHENDSLSSLWDSFPNYQLEQSDFEDEDKDEKTTAAGTPFEKE